MVPKWLDYACQIYGAAFGVVAIYSLSSFTLFFLLPYNFTRFLRLADWVEPASLLAIQSSSLCALVGCSLSGACVVTDMKFSIAHSSL